ncbi:MAG: ASCH domain-containing protein [Candidatus Aenigmatarchaeota archaeon]
MRALQVANISDEGKPYAELIVSGKKTWEIRNRNTRIRGRIGIVFGDKLVGTVEIVRTIGPASPEYLATFPHHMSTLERMRRYAKGRPLYAWVLKNAKKFKKPIGIKLRYVNKYDWVRL